MTVSQDQFRAALRDVADGVTEHDVPPLSLPADAPAGRRVVRRWRAGNHRLLVSVAAAVAVIAVIATSLILAGGFNQSGSNAGFRLGPDGVPPYYMELGYGTLDLEIRNTATGDLVATVRPPKPFKHFADVSVAADSWTFALVATKGLLPSRPVPTPIFLGQFNPGTDQVTLRRLSNPLTSASYLTGLAVSPNGRELAVAQNAQNNDADEISVYSLATGRAKVWRTSRLFFNLYADMSWSNSGTLAFDKTGGTKNLGLWLLNTSTPGGNLLSDSRHVVYHAAGPASLGSLLTTDGKKILVPVTTVTGYQGNEAVGTSEIQVFSAATGRLLRVLLHQTGLKPIDRDVVWANASGSALIVNVSNRVFKDGFAVLRGDRLTRIHLVLEHKCPTPGTHLGCWYSSPIFPG